MKILRLLALSFLTAQAVCAQHQNDNWYFGDSCALNFGSGSPVLLPQTHLYAYEGTSGISSANGDVLFYTDGMTVYNANHDTMINGGGLFGTNTSTQAALIVPDPAGANHYYIFTTAGNFDSAGFCYSRVDMTLDGGLGAVTEKNHQLLTPTTEKLTGIATSDGSGYWVITHQPSGNYVSYKISAAGVAPPVVSQVGLDISSFQSYIGQLRVSPDRKHIANAMTFNNNVEVSRFNDTTGTVTNSFLYPVSPSAVFSVYGVEFSKNGNLLYVSAGNTFPFRLFQVDLSNDDSASVVGSATLIYQGTNGVCSLQMGPDGKIYVAHPSRLFIGAISNPDSLGAACAYIDTAVTLIGECRRGLPNALVQPWEEYALPAALIQPQVTKICPDSCIAFGNGSSNATSYEWFFPGATPSYSTVAVPTVCYNASGTYGVTLVAHNGPYADTATSLNLIEVYEPPQPTVSQSNDTLVALNINGGDAFQWLYNGGAIPGATNGYYQPLQNGTYTVVVTNAHGCSGVASLVVTSVGIAAPQQGVVTVYPNPSDGVAYFDFGGMEGELVVYNTLGHAIKRLRIGQSVQLTDLPNGLLSYRFCCHGNTLYGKLCVVRSR